MRRHPIFTPEHEELRASVRRYVDTEVRPHVDEWETAGYFPDAVFRRCGELGFLGLQLMVFRRRAPHGVQSSGFGVRGSKRKKMPQMPQAEEWHKLSGG